MNSRVPRALFAGVVMTAALAALPAPAHAAGAPPAPPPPSSTVTVCGGAPGGCDTVPLLAHPLWRRSCGYISCTVYFNHGETRQLAWGQSVVLGAVGGLIGGPITGAVVAALVHGGEEAMAHGACMKLKIGPQYGTLQAPFETQWYTEADKGCR